MKTLSNTQNAQQAEPLRIATTREEIEETVTLYDFAADTLAQLRETNPESVTPAEGCAYVWNRPDIDKAADVLNIDRAALFGWCYDNSDFITTRVIIRAAIALSPYSPARDQAHRLFGWTLIKAGAQATTDNAQECGLTVCDYLAIIRATTTTGEARPLNTFI